MPLSPSERIGHYNILALIGRGGMGEVYRALDTKLNRTVAIKVLSDLVADPDARRRFQLEAQMASSLNHPHIITIHDVSEFEGRQYLVAEYIDGGTLRDWSNAQPRTWRDVLELLTGVADGLATAHEAGIVHRDIKPQNVLVTRNGYAKLADFGLAKLDERIGPEDETRSLEEGITRPGVVVGTVAYMSPEQVSGQRLDSRSDIFSFGVVVYEMLAGKRPFAGRSELEVLQSIRHASPELLGKGVPQAVRTVVEKALQKNPRDRYQSMREMVADLHSLLRQPGSSGSASNRPWKGILSAAAMALLALAVWKYWPAAPRPPIQRIAVLPLRDLSNDANQGAFSDGTTEAVILNLAQVHSLSVISHTSVMHYKGTRKTIPEIGRELHVDALVTGTVQRVGGRVRVSAQLIHAASDRNLWGRRFDRDGTDVLQLEEEVAQAIAREVQAQITPEESRRLASARKVNPAAYDEYLLGRYLTWKNNGAEAYHQAIRHLERAIQLDPNFSLAHAGLATAWCLRFANGYANLSEAEGPARLAAANAQRLEPDLAEVQATLAHVTLTFDWDWVNGEKLLRRALEIDPNSLDMCECLAIVLNTLGRTQEALAVLDRAMKLNPLSSPVESTYGSTLVLQRKPQEAIPHLRRAKELDPQNVDVPYFLALALEAMGKPDEAVKLVRDFGPTGMLVLAYARAGRRSDALKVIPELKDPWDLALAYVGLGDTSGALDAISAAIDRREFPAVSIKIDPTFDPLRSSPRFGQLVARLKIPDPTGEALR
jgi:serine/threonine protein kinase/Tfp pilus assembly protein PilF